MSRSLMRTKLRSLMLSFLAVFGCFFLVPAPGWGPGLWRQVSGSQGDLNPRGDRSQEPAPYLPLGKGGRGDGVRFNAVAGPLRWFPLGECP